MKNKIKLLLAEDDNNLGTILKDYLELKDFDVTWSKNGKLAETDYYSTEFDICLFDIMMPEMDGITLAKKLIKAGEDIPIIFLTAKSMQDDKIEGLKSGADDYITKPFSTEELLLRINAVLKRTAKKNKSGNPVFTIGKYNFDYLRRRLAIADKEKILTTKEADLLKILCENINNLASRSVILKEIWNNDDYFSGRSMDVYIAKLRNYLCEDTSIKIQTVHGTGFTLVYQKD
jgi:DNA-binding response OmpR family regulator